VDGFNYDSGFDIDEFLEQSQEEQRQRLETELERIEKQLEERDRVHEEVIDELESKLDWYTDRLESLYKQMRGKDGERSQLKTRINTFYKQIREEKQQHWQDKQELERQRRELLRKQREIESSSLDELLSDL
jgi:chaperonin cofactor prefoldin